MTVPNLTCTDLRWSALVWSRRAWLDAVCRVSFSITTVTSADDVLVRTYGPFVGHAITNGTKICYKEMLAASACNPTDESTHHRTAHASCFLHSPADAYRSLSLSPPLPHDCTYSMRM